MVSFGSLCRAEVAEHPLGGRLVRTERDFPDHPRGVPELGVPALEPLGPAGLLVRVNRSEDAGHSGSLSDVQIGYVTALRTGANPSRRPPHPSFAVNPLVLGTHEGSATAEGGTRAKGPGVAVVFALRTMKAGHTHRRNRRPLPASRRCLGDAGAPSGGGALVPFWDRGNGVPQSRTGFCPLQPDPLSRGTNRTDPVD